MSLRIAIVTFALLGLVIVAAFGQSESSVEFSKSGVSETEFDNSDDSYNFVSSSTDQDLSETVTYLSNFKSLHNSTDLQALATDNHPSVSVPENRSEEQVPSDRVDLNLRVLRGTGLELPTLDVPLFTPFKHNTIDTADFSDCALQGEWHPIGVPSNHYVHHEDRQKEHFHAAAEGPEAFPSSAISSTKHPIDPEGAAFWNEFINENKGNPFLMANSHHHIKSAAQTENHYKHHYPSKKRAPPRPSPFPFGNIEAFGNLGRPLPGESNFLKIKHKPIHHEKEPVALGLVATKPTFDDIDFALVQKAPHSGPDAAPTTTYKDTDFLSPPPAPHRFLTPKPAHIERPKVPPRPKYIHKPLQSFPPHFMIRGNPHPRPPVPPLPPTPQVLEQYKEPIPSNSYQHQKAEDSSTFTCGHQHSHGTNYHTASYQVEGESDPSLLDESPSETNQFATSQIIIGQPQFEHHLNKEIDLFNTVSNHRYPKTNEAIDVFKENTDNTHEELLKELEKGNTYTEHKEETSQEIITEKTSLETTAPQLFQTETDEPIASALVDNAQEPNTLSPSFSSGFDHSGFAVVDLSSFKSPIHNGDSFAANTANEPKFTQNDRKKFQFHFGENNANPVIVNQEHSLSLSQPGGFFGSQFGSSGFDKGMKHFRKVKQQVAAQSAPSSFLDFSPHLPPPKFNGKFHKDSIAVFHHTPHFPHNTTKTHMTPGKKFPKSDYEVNENSGEMIPLSAFFPPRKGPTQFNNRQPNFAVPKNKRPKVPPKYQSTIHFDGSGLEIYQTRPKSAVTRIKLKPKPTRGGPRYPEPDFRRSLKITSRID